MQETFMMFYLSFFSNISWTNFQDIWNLKRIFVENQSTSLMVTDFNLFKVEPAA